MRDDDDRLYLVTGATGYIGGRLVPELLAAGRRVRVLARHPDRLRDRPWVHDVDVVGGDLGDPSAVAAAMDGVSVAYYLAHSLTTGAGFEQTDADLASSFAAAAKTAGVQRIVYLGGMSPQSHSGSTLSAHLRSRGEVGRILRASGVPTVELRAAVIIGSGSASFEMLRYVSERLPVMVTPRWVRSRLQPIAIRDVLRYLVAAASIPPEVNRPFDIGGPDVLSYEDMMQRYAAVAGLRQRVIVGVPALSLGLSSLWVGLVTPVPSGIARPLVESLRHEVVCQEHDIARWIPDPPDGLLGFDRAVGYALRRIRDRDVPTWWAAASIRGAASEPLPSDPDWAGGTLYADDRRATAQASPATVWTVVEGLGGGHGWYSSTVLWAARGLLDRAVGGIGLRRGRRDPETLLVGEPLDFWRVEERQPPRLLRLRAEMRLPGRAWLEYRIDGPAEGPAELRQRAVFAPRGLAGHVYWWAVAPFHVFVFAPMARGIVREAEIAQRRTEPGRAVPASVAPGSAAADLGGPDDRRAGPDGVGEHATMPR
ncbi:MAG: SDR family oxidoreductase [Actinomycetota bacterium]|nr:MAG: SDR family oxidoreductase [Actinomycetota bacterium]